MESRKVFKLFYHQEIGTAVLSEFIIALRNTYLPTLPVFTGVSKFFIKSPGLPVRAPNLPGNTYRTYRSCFRDVKKDLVPLFELFSIGGRHTSGHISSTSSSGNSRIH